jgi:hypothetical protein
MNTTRFTKFLAGAAAMVVLVLGGVATAGTASALPVGCGSNHSNCTGDRN